MTVEEKRKELRKYCRTHDCGECTDERPTCIFTDDSDAWCLHYNVDNIPEELLEEVMKKITPITEDIVNHPNHYTHGGMECIDEMIMVFGKQTVMHFCLCNAWKYRYRAVYKNGEEDMKKSHWYMAKYKELRDGNYQ